MALKGVVVKFNPARGYGFIRCADGPGDLFVHISDVAGRRALVPGQRVTCDVVETARGPAARNVQPGAVKTSPLVLFMGVAGILAAAVAMPLTLQGSVPWWAAVFFGLNAATFLLYGYDKIVAGGRALRVPEAVLHLLAAAGGTPAAFAGQLIFGHKTRKGSFLRRFWLIVLLQAALIGGGYWCMKNPPPWFPDALRALGRTGDTKPAR